MATSSALGEFNNYINKFWGATDIVVTSGNGLQFSNQTLNTVENNALVHQTAERLVWGGLIGTTSSNTTFLRSEEHTSELQSQSNLVCRLLLEKKTICSS